MLLIETIHFRGNLSSSPPCAALYRDTCLFYLCRRAKLYYFARIEARHSTNTRTFLYYLRREVPVRFHLPRSKAIENESSIRPVGIYGQSSFSSLLIVWIEAESSSEFSSCLQLRMSYCWSSHSNFNIECPLDVHLWQLLYRYWHDNCCIVTDMTAPSSPPLHQPKLLETFKAKIMYFRLFHLLTMLQNVRDNSTNSCFCPNEVEWHIWQTVVYRMWGQLRAIATLWHHYWKSNRQTSAGS